MWRSCTTCSGLTGLALLATLVAASFTATHATAAAAAVASAEPAIYRVAHAGLAKTISGLATTSSSSRSGGMRSLQQAPLPQLPRFFVSRVSPAVTSTFDWKITRLASSSGVTVTADGNSREQIGYTLTYTRQLITRQYSVSGFIDVTNVSPNAQLTLSLINLVIGGQTYSAPCKTLPRTSYIMAPAEVLSCPFNFLLNTAPALPTGSISGYVQTNIGRQALNAPVPFSFAACTPTPIPTQQATAVGGSAGGSSGSLATPAAAAAAPSAAGAGSCTVRDIGGCVNITDGSYITMRFRDTQGTAMAGNVTQSRSQLFGVPEASPAQQGPPRIEPVVPTTPVPQAAPLPPPQNPTQMPTANWWTSGRKLIWDHVGSGSSSMRTLQQQQPQPPLQAPRLGPVTPSSQVKWPYPQVTGERPPVGLNGVPAQPSTKPLQICNTRQFAFSMFWGPLQPATCGTYEVQNTAGALFADNSRPPISVTTLVFLQVICPAAPQAAARTPGG